MKIQRIEGTDELIQAIKDNDGYCLCSIKKDETTKCPCKEFRMQNVPGQCHCGVYEKI